MDYPPDRLEVIAVDDHGSDSISSEISQRFPGVRLLQNNAPLGCNSAKRLGAANSRADIIAFTDADCTVSPNWASAVAEDINTGSDAVTGPVRHPRTLLRELVGIADFPDYQTDYSRNTDAYVGCNYAIRRELFRTLKFRECPIPVGGDRLESWLLHKAGRKIYYDPRMVVYHTPKVDAASILERRLRYGMKALMMRKIDPTLPGGRLIDLGLLAAPAYITYKFARDAGVLFSMSMHHHVNPWHAPFLLPLLLLFRLLDGAGLISSQYNNLRKKGSPNPEA
jgi:glycosyltransferase involved in cell wall biosynthesis